MFKDSKLYSILFNKCPHCHKPLFLKANILTIFLSWAKCMTIAWYVMKILKKKVGIISALCTLATP